jgi:O-antigen/teichoic acid export membrane protein
MKINNSSNTSQAFWIALGQFIALCLTIGSTMILTRYMDKFNYGTYRQVFYVYTTLLSVFTLGLPKSYGYFLPRMSKEEGKDFVNKLTRIFILLGAVFSLILFIGAPIIAGILKNQELLFALRIFSPVPIFLMPTLGLEAIYATYRETHMAAIYSIVTRILLFICVTIPAFLFSISYREVVLGFVLSAFLNFILALYLKNRPFRKVTKVKTSVTVTEIMIFCLPLMGAGIFNILINSTDQFFISRYFGTETFAEYSNGAMELPFIGMIVGACSTVLLPVYSSLSKNKCLSHDDSEKIVNIWNNVLCKTVMLIFPLIIYCIVYSDEVMVVLYGKQYLVSGKYFFIMLFNNFFSVISCYPLLLALNKAKEYSLAYLFNFVLLAFFEYVVIRLFSTVEAVCVVSVLCLCLRVIIFMQIIAHELKVKVMRIIPTKTVVYVVLLSVVLATTLHNLIYIDSYLVSIIVTLPIFFVALLGLSKPLKLDYLSIVKPLLKK